MGAVRHGLVGKVDGADVWHFNFPGTGDNRDAWFLLGTSDDASCYQSDIKGAAAWTEDEARR
eukprot:7483549-Karenia_brevis.AAC.1